MAELNIAERQAGDVTVLDMDGKITIGEGSVALRTAVRRMLEENKKKILLNLAGVGYIDSSGIGELVSSYTAINKDGGRDHWPRVSCALLAGGGMKMGQVIGATDRLGGEASERPVHFQEVFATLYHNMGIDVNKATVTDLSGRPHSLVDGHQPMRELI